MRQSLLTTIAFVYANLIYSQGQTYSINEHHSMKNTIKNYIEQLYSSEYQTAIDQYLSTQYVEHQESANFSKEGLKEYIRTRLDKYPNLTIKVHRMIEQEDLIFLHTEEKASNKKTFIRGELFRIENGKIAEHWSATQEHPKKTKSGRKMYDGPTVDYSKNSGREYSEYTKQAYMDLNRLPLDELFVSIDSSTTDQYLQHNPSARDGKESFKSLVKLMKNMGKLGIKPRQDIKTVIAEGDFIVIFSYFKVPLIFGDTVVFDLFRLTNDGKKDEHWDIIGKIKKKNIEKSF